MNSKREMTFFLRDDFQWGEFGKVNKGGGISAKHQKIGLDVQRYYYTLVLKEFDLNFCSKD